MSFQWDHNFLVKQIGKNTKAKYSRQVCFEKRITGKSKANLSESLAPSLNFKELLHRIKADKSVSKANPKQTCLFLNRQVSFTTKKCVLNG